MRIEQLRAFEAVSRLGHFTHAAESLFLAQPSLSRQISSLEAELGAPLFHRLPGGATLTAAGETLLPVARRMLAEDDAVRRTIADLGDLTRGRVRLGATPSLCLGLLTEALVEFRADYPGIELHVTERGSRELVDRLAEGALDLALIVGERHHPSIEHTPLLHEELVVAASAQRPPDDFAPTLSLAELARLPFVAFHEGYDLRASTDEAFAAAGVTPSVVVTGAEMDAVLRFVERGIGVALVPAMVLIDRPTLCAARVLGAAPRRTVSVAQRAGVEPGRAGNAMLETIRATAGVVVAEGTPMSEFAALAGSRDSRAAEATLL